MSKTEKEILVRLLNNTIQDTDRMFYGQEVSHATIIGYLQGTVKAVIGHLEE
jgi:hypothetical protein